MAEVIQKVIQVDATEAQISVRSLQKEARDLRDQLLNLDETSNEYSSTVKQLASVQETLNNVMRITRTTVTAAEGSYDALVQQMAKLRKEWRATNDEAQRNALGAQIAEINEQLKTLDASTGNYQRNVGNYSSAFNGLNLQVQQVARELPSLTMGANQFFLAISNNLPMLTDEIKNLRQQGVSATTVIKQIITSMLSWQTALVIVITLLSSFGKEIGEWVVSLFKGKDAIDLLGDSMTKFSSNFVTAQAQLDATLDSLRSMEKGTAEYAATLAAAQEKYGKYLKTEEEWTAAINGEADAYERLTKAVSANSIAMARNDALRAAFEGLEKYAEKSLAKLEKAFTDKFGEEQGAEQLQKFLAGFRSQDDELRKVAEDIYAQFDIIGYAQSGDMMKMGNEIVNQVNTLRNAFDGYDEAVERTDKRMQALSSSLGLTAEDYEKTAESVADATEKIDATEKVRTETLKLQQSIREENRQNELRTLKENYDEAVKAFDERLKTETIAEEQQQAYRLALAEKFRADMAEINAKWDEADMEQFRTMAEQQIAEAESVAERIMTAYNTRSGLINSDKQRSTNSLNLLESTSSAAVIDDDTLTEEQKQQRLTEISAEYEQLRFEAQQRYAQQRIDLMRETLAAIEAVEGEGSANALSMQQQIADAEIELLVDANNRKKALYEADAAKQEAAEKQKQKNTKATARIMQQSLSGIANLLGTLGDVYEQEGETSKKAAKTSKALKIAEATINTINGGIAAYMAIQSSSGIFGTILGAIQMATVLATGYANIAKIKAVNVDNPSESGGSSSSIGASVNPPAVIQQVPVTTTVTGAAEEALLNQMVTAQNATANNTASAQRVYVVYSDIAQAGRRVAVQTSESTF